MSLESLLYVFCQKFCARINSSFRPSRSTSFAFGDYHFFVLILPVRTAFARLGPRALFPPQECRTRQLESQSKPLVREHPTTRFLRRLRVPPPSCLLGAFPLRMGSTKFSSLRPFSAIALASSLPKSCSNDVSHLACFGFPSPFIVCVRFPQRGFQEAI